MLHQIIFKLVHILGDNAENNQKLQMKSNTTYRIIKIIIYILVGFAAAFFWHQMKSNQ